jgi:unsaturated rhamnogalacturonyl hydrolase
MKLRLILALLLCNAAVASDATDITAVMRRVFDWQVANPWSSQHDIAKPHGNRGWVQGAFLTGVMEASRATGDAAYVDYARRTADANGWQLGPRAEHADDHIVGQTYLELHALDPQAGRLEATKAGMDALIAKPLHGRELWWWCDALYMAPPTLAKLSRVTGDTRYVDAMDRWYWESYAEFYDPVERLFYRDKRYLFPKEGPKVFWSRGNGWVIAGLARLLDALPAEHPRRTKYIALFQAMASRLVEVQPADGLWRSDLLNPGEAHGETSGSAFFCYALAWGINQGVLPAEKYRPAVERTWTALLACVDAEGRLGWVQPIGFAPGAYDATTSQEYGAGAFLAAGSQVMKLPR